MMLKKYYPTYYVEDVFSINYQKLYDSGIRGVLFDIDNTLVPHGKDSTPQVDALFQKIRETGLQPFLLSDNSEERILRFNKNIGAPYLAEAGKPDPAPYEEAIRRLGLSKDQVIMVGDQVFTDILGANSCEIPSILVKYIGFYKEEWKGIHRNLEKIILWFYRKGSPDGRAHV